jgi:membrane protein
MIASALGFATLFFGGTSAVTELRDALNTIWRVPDGTQSSHARSLFDMLLQRIYCFALVLGAGVVLFASVALHTWILPAAKYTRALVPMAPALMQAIEGTTSFVMIALLFAFLFKTLPAVRLQWSDVFGGAVLTALLFTLGKFLLSVYLIQAGFADNYGAAGSLVVLLVWIYYSAQVVLLGAEFTRAYALGFGTLVVPPAVTPHSCFEGCVHP